MKHSGTLRALACLAVSISLSGCMNAIAPNSLSEEARGLQREARAIARGRGYAGSQVFNSSALDERETDEVRLTLKGGARYMAIGLCDKGCKDIDLGVYDEDGIEIASDRQEDAIPIVELTPKKDGVAVFRVKMIRCDLEPCRYGVGVYRD